MTASEPTTDSFLAIGVALTMIMCGEIAVFFLEQLRSRLGDRGVALPPLPDSFIFLALGAVTASLLQFEALSSTTAAVVRGLGGQALVWLSRPGISLV